MPDHPTTPRASAVLAHLRASTPEEVRATKERLIEIGMPLTPDDQEQPKYWWKDE